MAAPSRGGTRRFNPARAYVPEAGRAGAGGRRCSAHRALARAVGSLCMATRSEEGRDLARNLARMKRSMMYLILVFVMRTFGVPCVLQSKAWCRGLALMLQVYVWKTDRVDVSGALS